MCSQMDYNYFCILNNQRKWIKNLNLFQKLKFTSEK